MVMLPGAQRHRGVHHVQGAYPPAQHSGGARCRRIPFDDSHPVRGVEEPGERGLSSLRAR